MKTPKFVFVSNYINHHQIPFCNAMYEMLGDDFVFVQTESMEEERIRMGWQQENKCPYVVLYWEEEEKVRRWIEECQVVLFGGTDEESYIVRRLQRKSPVIRYSERLYKEGQWKAVSPRGLLKKYKDHTKYRRDKVYMLCAGAYVPSDFKIVAAYPGKLLCWGYFPETRQYDTDRLMAEKQPASILWAARFIDWKHPELPLLTARRLKEKGIAFHMNMVGDGELKQQVKILRKEYGLEDCVTLSGYKSPGEVRELMERSDIYLMTSDRREGWGAVVNEAMNSGCAVVANHMAGAVPFLVRHKKNGMVYKDGHKEMLADCVEELLLNRDECQRMGRAALNTILTEWNAEKAAERLLGLCVREGFLAENEIKKRIALGVAAAIPMTGPCSAAPVIGERKMYRKLKEVSE